MSDPGEEFTPRDTEKSSRVIIEISAIETPKGLVPTLDSLKSFVDAFNKAIASIHDAIFNIINTIATMSDRLENTERLLNSIAMRLDLVITKLSELKIKIESTKIRESPEARKKSTDEDLKEKITTLFKDKGV